MHAGADSLAGGLAGRYLRGVLPIARRLTFGFFAALVLTACGGATARQVDALRAEVSDLRAKSATLEAKVERLERRGDSHAKAAPVAREQTSEAPLEAAAAAPFESPDADDRPDLEVVRLAPANGGPAGHPGANDNEHAIVLRSGPSGIVVEERASDDGEAGAGSAEPPRAPRGSKGLSGRVTPYRRAGEAPAPATSASGSKRSETSASAERRSQ